jgi:hypothetical protein
VTATGTPVNNGVNVEVLLGVRDALADTPEIARFQWRATNTWVNGTHSRTSVETFHGFNAEQRHRSTFIHDADHPLAFAAEDNGITPVEYVLVGNASGGPGAAARRRHRRRAHHRSPAGRWPARRRSRWPPSTGRSPTPD